jgi:RimJ/RimL family protein N-acetyltransferase
MPTPELRTARLSLAPYVPADEESFVGLFQDTRVSRWMGDGPQEEAADRALFGRIFSKVYSRDLFAVWAVRADGRYVGHAEIKRTDTVDGHEIVYALHPDAWGRGLGGELAEAVTGHGFGPLGLTRVYATVAAANHASLRALARLGYRHVRDIPQDTGGVTRVLACDRS